MNITYKVKSSRLISISFLAAMLWAVGLPVRANDIINQQVHGKFINSYYEFPGPTECQKVIVYIFGDNTFTAQNGQKSVEVANVGATYIIYDQCLDTYPSIASGYVPMLSKFAVQVFQNRSQINAAFFIQDQVSALIPVSINAVFKSDGNTYSSKDVFHDIGSDYVFIGRFFGSFTTAVPSGTITFGSTSYDLGTASYVDILFGQANTGNISISH
ncbi:MAG: hypothetical protein ACR65R_07620 [Methylomicrobium sp.]